MSVREKLLYVRPRENAGSDAYNRFKFQIAVAIETIIRLAKNKKDFITLMDYLNDFVVIENFNKDYEKITFYQVKSKEKGLITINVIIKNLWLRKLYEDQSDFKEEFPVSVLVTNNGIKWQEKEIVDNNYVSLKELFEKNNSEYIKLIDTVKDINPQICINDFEKFYLLKTELSLNDYERQLKGELNEYATKCNSKLTASSLLAIYEKIWKEMELKQKNIYNPSEIEEKDLFNTKAFSSQNFNDVVNATCSIQLPEKQEISDFITKTNYYYGNISLLNFIESYETFTQDYIISGRLIMTHITAFLNENKEQFYYIKDNSKVSIKIVSLLDENTIINNTDFYIKYKYCITIMYLYKKCN